MRLWPLPRRVRHCNFTAADQAQYCHRSSNFPIAETPPVISMQDLDGDGSTGISFGIRPAGGVRHQNRKREKTYWKKNEKITVRQSHLSSISRQPLLNLFSTSLSPLLSSCLLSSARTYDINTPVCRSTLLNTLHGSTQHYSAYWTEDFWLISVLQVELTLVYSTLFRSTLLYFTQPTGLETSLVQPANWT